MSRFLAVWEEIIDHPVWTDAPASYAKVFVYMLVKARWKDAPGIRRGQLSRSIRQIADDNNLDKDTVHRATRWLRRQKMLTLRTRGSRSSLWTVVNYNKYQSLHDQRPHETDRHGDKHGDIVVPVVPSKPPMSEEVEQLFGEWVRLRRESYGKTSTVRLTPPRRTLIRARLRDGYSVGQLIAALVGATHSEWVRENEQFDFQHIFRPRNIDRYVEKGSADGVRPAPPAKRRPTAADDYAANLKLRERDD